MLYYSQDATPPTRRTAGRPTRFAKVELKTCWSSSWQRFDLSARSITPSNAPSSGGRNASRTPPPGKNTANLISSSPSSSEMPRWASPFATETTLLGKWRRNTCRNLNSGHFQSAGVELAAFAARRLGWFDKWTRRWVVGGDWAVFVTDSSSQWCVFDRYYIPEVRRYSWVHYLVAPVKNLKAAHQIQATGVPLELETPREWNTASILSPLPELSTQDPQTWYKSTYVIREHDVARARSSHRALKLCD